MPNENSNSISWTTSEFEKLVELVKPYPFLYSVKDPSRKDILARESTWEVIGRDLKKPAEECKKRWRALRDGYMKSMRIGSWNKPKLGLFTKLEFLNQSVIRDDQEQQEEQETEEQTTEKEDTDQQVITDNQEYYEITLVETPEENKTVTLVPKLILPQVKTREPIKIGRKNCGRKRSMPIPLNLQPIKILPKPANMLNGANLVQLVEDTSKVVPQPQTSQLQRSDVLDSLIERVLNEHTNSVDVFFRSMAASVKKLPPTLIPKVKMEVCNVIAKYEMQSLDKNNSS